MSSIRFYPFTYIDAFFLKKFYFFEKFFKKILRVENIAEIITLLHLLYPYVHLQHMARFCK